MDAKLKSLKVTDLRDLLTKAGEPAPSKANKQDLIARVSASQAALAAYRAKYEAPAAGEAPAMQEEDELVDYTDDVEPAAAPVSAAVPSPPEPAPAASTAAPTSAIAATNSTASAAKAGNAPEAPAADSTSPSTEAAPAVPYDWRNDPAVQEKEDDPPDLKARKARCRRFNVPLVNPTAPTPERKGRRGQGNKTTSPNAQKRAASAVANAESKPPAKGNPIVEGLSEEDKRKLEMRKKRFEQLLPGQMPPKPAPKQENGETKLGANAPPTSPRGTKRTSAEAVDPEEQAKRQRRAERYNGKKSAAETTARQAVQTA
ncbi:uncharacterized protein SCHCODRAFT_02506852 [Schizophyllum commune H4-8]|nr:uncharacterized protein SCHCODRAFT_02506852 [Schizophyllum commune H4-8]KAI5890855.1 hypothetical protein SCHCODRAFT_02506852 [Schizophyllum commune H4-8]